MSTPNLSSVNLNLLLALDALLRDRSVTRAAQRMNLSQSALSHSLKNLRELFEDPLLVQRGRQMLPTPLANALAEPLRRGLQDLQSTLHLRAVFDPVRSMRSFAIATSDYLEVTGIGDVLAWLQNEAPHVRLALSGVDAESAEGLDAGTLDLAIAGAALPANTGRMQRHHFFSEGYLCIARKGHPSVKASTRRQPTVSRATFLRLRHVLVAFGREGPSAVDIALAASSERREIALRVPHFSGAPPAVAQSDLVCTLPETVARRAAALYPLVTFKPPVMLADTATYVWWSPRFDNEPGNIWLRRAILSGDVFQGRLHRIVRAARRRDKSIGA